MHITVIVGHCCHRYAGIRCQFLHGTHVKFRGGSVALFIGKEPAALRHLDGSALRCSDTEHHNAEIASFSKGIECGLFDAVSYKKNRAFRTTTCQSGLCHLEPGCGVFSRNWHDACRKRVSIGIKQCSIVGEWQNLVGRPRVDNNGRSPSLSKCNNILDL